MVNTSPLLSVELLSAALVSSTFTDTPALAFAVVQGEHLAKELNAAECELP